MKMNVDLSESGINRLLTDLSTPSVMGVMPSIEPMIRLLNRMDNPQHNFRAIHVGGTSGKGSTSTFLANIFIKAGYKVGLFTKPHLQSVRERFTINGELITPEEMLAQLERIGAVMPSKPTWFEMTAAVAFQYFSDQQVDLAVIEVGLGGTYDATNVFDPELSILTNVGLDHTDVLGDTVELIAADKAGIIKAGRPTVSGVDQPAVVTLLEERCRQVHSDLSLLGRDFSLRNINLGENGSRFDFESASVSMTGMQVGMLGLHQVYNAGLAVQAALVLDNAGLPIPQDAIRTGLKQTVVPGRMEIVHRDPLVILDGAHSPPKMAALVKSIQTLFPGRERLISVISVSNGHDAGKTLHDLAGMLDQVILTEFSAETDYGNKRAQNSRTISEYLHGIYPELQQITEPDPVCAVNIALKNASSRDLILVTGSIFLVGQVRQYLATQMENSSV